MIRAINGQNHGVIMISDIIPAIRADLSRQVDQKTRDSAQRFFKEEVKFYGIKSAAVKKAARGYFARIKGEDKKEIFSLCEDLYRSDYSEEAFIASEWAYMLRKRFEPSDFYVFERWIGDYINNWAKCDTFCNHTMGSFVEQYPEYVNNLKEWTKSENRWLRRASAVTFILPARKGLFFKEVLEISDLLMGDEDDLVRKGQGWVLKEASKSHQYEVFCYIMDNKKAMSRTALRYAIEKMPQDMRRKAMEKKDI